MDVYSVNIYNMTANNPFLDIMCTQIYIFRMFSCTRSMKWPVYIAHSY